MAVDTSGHWLVAQVTPAPEPDRAQVAHLAQAVQEVTEQNVEVAFVDQGYTGHKPEQAAADHDIPLVVIKLPDAKKALSCGRIVGSWSVLLAGWPVFAVWPVIISAYLIP
jgi:hypothetical protein